MPVACPGHGKPRFRFKHNKDGTKTRLVFCGDNVIEATHFDRHGKKLESHKEAHDERHGNKKTA